MFDSQDLSEGSATNQTHKSNSKKSRHGKQTSNQPLISKTLDEDLANEVFDEQNDFDEWVARIETKNYIYVDL